MVIVKKPNGNTRLCIDSNPLNKALKRNNYSTQTIVDLLPELNNAKIFSVVVAMNKFWHVERDDESRFLTTFCTLLRRYSWKKMPFVISSAPEAFQRRIDEALEGLNCVKCVHDDILVCGSMVILIVI